MSNNEGFPFNHHSNTPSRAPQSHRCNEHLEDVLKGLSTWPMDVAAPFHVFLSCLKSKPGEEPPLYSSTSDHTATKKD
ncbi:hypothetical protein BC941DRAFT_414062 [Chlamydoabsidia padenii]|nr:hypothetical protein BC941DRAFT_414062 [Chlamydoabsidia padenii]